MKKTRPFFFSSVVDILGKANEFEAGQLYELPFFFTFQPLRFILTEHIILPRFKYLEMRGSS